MKDNEKVYAPVMRSPLVLSVLAAALALGGCASQQIPHALPHEAQTPEAVQAAVLSQFADLQSRNMMRSYLYLTAGCSRQVSFSEFNGQVTSAIWWAEHFSGIKVSELELRDVSVLEFTAERAVYVTSAYYEDRKLRSEPVEMVYEDGSWRSPDCPWAIADD